MSTHDSTNEPRRAGRRETDPAVETAGRPVQAGTNLPVVAGPLIDPRARPAGPVEAQLLGQDGQKRGLRGGKPVLDKARSAYLGAEWSGKADRRPRSGIITKTEI